jgi:transcriptional regulator with XRE-family HTH domain
LFNFQEEKYLETGTEGARLPGNMGERIGDLRTARHLSIKELAGHIGMDPTTLSRIERGEIGKISGDKVTELSKFFDVSSDFLLGITDIPDRKNYDIGELGLTGAAAKALYTRKVDPEIICSIIEDQRCPEMMQAIRIYLMDSDALGVKAQNDVSDVVEDMLMAEAVRVPEKKDAMERGATDVRAMKRDPYERDYQRISDSFIDILKDIKRKADSGKAPEESITKKTLLSIIGELKKGSDVLDPTTVTPEQVIDATTATISGVVSPGVLKIFRKLMELLMGALGIHGKQGSVGQQ